MELLLPAKGLKHLFAAFEYGGDACYLGIGKLNARASATNFSTDDFKKGLSYAREKSKKLYIVFNTLLKEKELPRVFSAIDEIYDLKLDGIIIQDIGLGNIIRREFPKIPLIASTQMGFHNVSGVKFAEDFGFKRVILARELTLQEIEKIKKSTAVEIEVFIHGAICFTYSGFCFASSFIGGKSGNRGKCSQVCRMLFDGDFKGHLFNLKDLKSFKYIKELHNIGVNSLKIEGRLKDELYVAVNAFVYRTLMDSAVKNEKIDLEKLNYLNAISEIVFSRKTWNGYFKNSKPQKCIDPVHPGNYGLFLGKVKKSFNGKFQMDSLSFPVKKHDGIQVFGNGKPKIFKVKSVKGNLMEIAGKEKVKTGSRVYLVHSVNLQNKFPIKEIKKEKIKPELQISIKIDREKFIIEGLNPIRELTEIVEKPIKTEKARKTPVTETEIVEEFEKSGNFSFKSKITNVAIPENRFIPKSVLSAIRKEVFKIFEKNLFKRKRLNKLSAIRFNHRLKKVITVDGKNIKSLIKANIATKDTIVFLKSNLSKDFLELREKFENIGYSLPLITKPYEEEKLGNFVKKLLSKGINNFLLPHFYGLKLLEGFQNINIFGDFPLHTTNRETLNFLKEKNFVSATLSVENDKENIKEIASEGAAVILFQDTPLFISQICIKRNFENCPEKQDSECEKIRKIVKKAGKKEDVFFLKFDECKTVMFWEKPLNLSKFKGELKNCNLIERYDFINRKYSPEEIERVISGKLKEGHAGNYNRTLL